MHTYTTYKDWDQDSSVKRYCLGDTFIIVEFKSGDYRFYKYTDYTAGSNAIAQMKRFACANDGLGSYISNNRPKFETKSRIAL